MPTPLTKKGAEITFRCGHKRLFQFPFPKKGDTLWDPDCGAERTVIDAPPAHTLGCNKCSYGSGTRMTNQLLEPVIARAKRHVNERPSHKVIIRDGDEAVYFVEKWDEGPMTSGQSLRTVASDIQSIGRLDN
jgi:hypothetical protein